MGTLEPRSLLDRRPLGSYPEASVSRSMISESARFGNVALRFEADQIRSGFGISVETRGTRTVQRTPVSSRSHPFLTGHCRATAAL
jgi:hypothetical protein